MSASDAQLASDSARVRSCLRLLSSSSMAGESAGAATGMTPVRTSSSPGGPMTGPDHYRKAEELTEKAHEYLGQGDGQDSAAVWAAVAQIHATLALAAA